MNPEFATPVCPGTLTEHLGTYSVATLRRLFGGRKVFHVLPYNGSWNQAPAGLRFQPSQWKGLEVTGFNLKQNHLVPSRSGTYKLYTSSRESSFRLPLELPGNAHLTLQLARQVYEIDTVPNAMIFFHDGQPALICLTSESSRSIASNYTRVNKSKALVSAYDFSFTALMEYIERFMATSLLQKEELFRRILFWYVVADSETNLENIHYQYTEYGDTILAPLQISFNSRLHFLGSDIAPTGGIYPNDKHSPEFREFGHYTGADFLELGKRIGMNRDRLQRIFRHYIAQLELALNMTDRAFMNEEAKRTYKFHLSERTKRLETAFA